MLFLKIYNLLGICICITLIQYRISRLTYICLYIYYADDLCLLSLGVHGLNELLSISAKYATYHDIVFNEHKSVCLYFKSMHFKIKPVNSIYLNGVRIKIDSHCKYLGHIVSDDLSDNMDINKQLRSLYSRSNMLLRTSGECLPNVKQHLFLTYCGSMYTIQLWCGYTKKQYKKIIVAHNNVFYKFLGYDR